MQNVADARLEGQNRCYGIIRGRTIAASKSKKTGRVQLTINSIILWADPREETFERTSENAFHSLQELFSSGLGIEPKYLTARKKKDVIQMDWNFDTFKSVLQGGSNKEGNKTYSDLGYSVSFFSSLTERESASISMTVGVTNPNFNNTFIINLPRSLDISDQPLVTDKLVSVFKGCVQSFQPFWGGIINKTNARRFDGYFDKSLPTTTHWVNYWGENITLKIGLRKLQDAPFGAIERLNGGFIVQLKEKPIDDNFEQDVQLQKLANKYFKL